MTKDLIRRADALALPHRLSPSLDAADGYYVSVDAIRAIAPVQVDPAHIRAEALREAANVDWSYGRDTTDTAPDYLTDWQRGLVSGQKSMRDAILALIPTPASPGVTAGEVPEHYDDYAVRQFAKMMSDKMAASRAKGRSGWNNPERCSVDYLRSLLYEHLDKGDPVDVANICMMLRHYEASTYREYCNCEPAVSDDVGALEKSMNDAIVAMRCASAVVVSKHELARLTDAVTGLRAALAKLKGGAE